MIRPMTAADVPSVAALEKLCFSDPWSVSSIASELDNPLSLWLVWEEDGTAAAYLGVQRVPPQADVMNVAVSPALRRFGITTPWAPAHSAVRIIAPRLWGSEISSHTTMRGFSPLSAALFKICSTLTYSRTAARAMTP